MKDRAVVFAAILLLSLTGIASLHAEGPFHIEHEWKIGSDGGWDYLAVDPQSKLLYITRGDHVIVVDTSQGKQVADITGLHGTHCVVFSSTSENPRPRPIIIPGSFEILSIAK